MRINTSTELLPAARRGKPLKLKIDNKEVMAYEGETVATVLLAEGIRVFGKTESKNHFHGIYCGMGICYECLVTIDDIPNLRACQTTVVEGMNVHTKEQVKS